LVLLVVTFVFVLSFTNNSTETCNIVVWTDITTTTMGIAPTVPSTAAPGEVYCCHSSELILLDTLAIYSMGLIRTVVILAFGMTVDIADVLRQCSVLGGRPICHCSSFVGATCSHLLYT